MIEKIFAAESTPTEIGGSISGGGLGRIGQIIFGAGEQGGVDALKQITNLVSAVIGFMTSAAAIWFIFMILIGGYTWMSSMGDKHKLEQARDRIVYAMIGLVIVVASWALLALVGLFFGWDTVIDNPVQLIQYLRGNMQGN
jgi:hypothetical protein